MIYREILMCKLSTESNQNEKALKRTHKYGSNLQTILEAVKCRELFVTES